MITAAFSLLLPGVAIGSAVMLLLWVVLLAIRNDAIVDVGWAAGLGLLAAFYASVGPGYAIRRYAIAAMISLWSLRLAHLP